MYPLKAPPAPQLEFCFTPNHSYSDIHGGKLKETLPRIELPIAEHKKSHANELSCAFKIRISENEKPVSCNKME